GARLPFFVRVLREGRVCRSPQTKSPSKNNKLQLTAPCCLHQATNSLAQREGGLPFCLKILISI
ncbi:MAG: hypothetical protein KKG40_06280, partial [Gammaproteobacteria bacterium]|nr:hypothetical protein [Gammaproteobacteria bacterium]